MAISPLITADRSWSPCMNMKQNSDIRLATSHQKTIHRNKHSLQNTRNKKNTNVISIYVCMKYVCRTKEYEHSKIHTTYIHIYRYWAAPGPLWMVYISYIHITTPEEVSMALLNDFDWRQFYYHTTVLTESAAEGFAGGWVEPRPHTYNHETYNHQKIVIKIICFQ